ncbi:hypothetical protein TTHERM_000055939 (macronuclear) [Tetrahymena thermophila SB210]|uniref:Uncharacterized protein n=1 Tax=Tetrahymena thermophila (strain SB210) TaxID=312017 RepID=W7XLL9_TETTS|nr:hypothetical protein TTHERM_000055939 [Tetrahymena thermophila SB210]EWS76519.1 hypothetical protein TTHERM_000055939 [Tetrahymena thermophila SB210]|eukprot:XP_012650946.1 hypothetical protein TTHERM_000055939 [Tetrahymena thermophila SB210]
MDLYYFNLIIRYNNKKKNHHYILLYDISNLQYNHQKVIKRLSIFRYKKRIKPIIISLDSFFKKTKQ